VNFGPTVGDVDNRQLVRDAFEHQLKKVSSERSRAAAGEALPSQSERTLAAQSSAGCATA
jgi:hypothetical protein